ncbi:hypothetical protein Tco_1229100 [Tanacetum coccineum]
MPSALGRGESSLTLDPSLSFALCKEVILTSSFIAIRIPDVLIRGTPPCLAISNDLIYLFKVDSDLLTKDIMGFKTYEDYKDDWIYEWNKDISWVDEKLWTEAGVWTKPKPVKHTCKPFNYKTGCSEWPTCSWREDGYEDSELKDKALRNKVIMEGLISDDESCNDCWKRWKSHEIYYHNYDEVTYQMVRSHLRFKRHTNEQCNKIPPLLKDLGSKEIDEYWWRIYKSGDLEVLES